MVVEELFNFLIDLPTDMEVVLEEGALGEANHCLYSVDTCVRETIGPNEDAVFLRKGDGL